MGSHSINGEWRGQFQYDLVPKTRGGDFNAFFSESSGRIEGTIVDDSGSGRATLEGSFSFPSVQFTKLYARASQAKYVDKETKIVPKGEINLGFFGIKLGQKIHTTTTTTETFGNPVEYQGSMSEDGKTMSGKWSISNKNATQSGTWTMQRLEEQENTKEAEEMKEKVNRVKEPQLEA